MKTKFTKSLFKLIYNAIIEKCENTPNFEALGKGEALFGFGQFSDDRKSPTIKNIMLEDIKVQEYLKRQGKNSFNGKYLYTRLHESQSKKHTEVMVTSFYLGLYLNFVGIKSVDELLERFKQQGKLNELEQDQQKALNSNTQPIRGENLQFYRGFYFSFKTDEVKSFELQIDEPSASAQLVGLHDSIISKGSSKTKYIGEIESLDRNLNFELRSELNEMDKITLVLYHGARSLENQTYLRGIYLAISHLQYPFSGETILTKMENKEGEMSVKPSMERVIKQYLYLERKSFYSPRQYLFKDTDLQPRQKSVDSLANLVGYFKAWSFSFYSRDPKEQKNIKGFQSKLSIHDDYSTEFYSAYGHNAEAGSTKLKLRIWVTTDPKGIKRASITVFEEEELMIKNHAIVDIPDKPNGESTTEEINSFQFVKGVFCSLGTKNKDFLASALILERIDIDVYNKFTPRSFSYDEAKDKKAYDELVEHYEKTTVQQKKTNRELGT